MAGRVEGKVALVTGAARGMGRSHAVTLAREGADVIVVDVCAPLPDILYPSSSPEDLDETVALAEKEGVRVRPIVADVRDLEAMRSGVDEAVAELGRLDTVVANAGIAPPMAWDEVTAEVLENTMSINVTGVWNTVMVGAPHLVSAGGGSVVLISSAAGLKVQPFLVHYTTSKWAVRGMSQAFAAELAEHHIRVNSVHPGATDTLMSTGTPGMEHDGGFGRFPQPRLLSMFGTLLPVTLIAPQDISNAVLYLASDESRYVTGHEVAVDAGTSKF